MNELEQLTTQIKNSFEGLINSVASLQEYRTTARIHHSTLELIVGDIAEQDVDVLVNATNTALSGGSSDVDSAIHQAAGPQLVAASRTLAPCRAGDAVLTPGFQLPTPWIIHTVGPIYAGGHQDEAAILDKAYRNSMRLAVQSGLTRIAFSSISTDAYDYPINEAAQIALGTVLEFIDGYRNSELLIRFVLDKRADFVVYDTILKEFAEPSSPPPNYPPSNNLPSNNPPSNNPSPNNPPSNNPPSTVEDDDREEQDERAEAAISSSLTSSASSSASAVSEEVDETEADKTEIDTGYQIENHSSWGRENEEVVSVDLEEGFEAEADIYVDIDEEVLSVDIEIEQSVIEQSVIEQSVIEQSVIEQSVIEQPEADISIDSESINDKPPFLEIHPTISLDSMERERYVAQDDIKLVSAREELESALGVLQSAQDEFRLDQEEATREEATRAEATRAEAEKETVQDEAESYSTSAVDVALVTPADEPVSDEPVSHKPVVDKPVVN